MNIPDAAIEAIQSHLAWTELEWDLCKEALEAAMPAIREAIAQELETSPHPPNAKGCDRCAALRDAARIVRGGTP